MGTDRQNDDFRPLRGLSDLNTEHLDEKIDDSKSRTHSAIASQFHDAAGFGDSNSRYRIHKNSCRRVCDGFFHRIGNEKPAHRVVISRGFEIGKYEVRQADWERVMGSNPSYFKGVDLPVEQVSWHDVQSFIKRINERKDGYLYRLPTEAEWEYAARAGATTDYGGTGNVSEMGWYSGNSGEKTHPVGTKKPNAWGLYDMHGNAWEWCQDWYDKGYYSNSPTTDPHGPPSRSQKVCRGGGWSYPADRCKSTSRAHPGPEDRHRFIGFRLVRVMT